MAETYKILGQVAPTSTDPKVLYSTPANTEALVSNITVANRSASSQTVNAYIFNSALIDSTIPTSGLFVAVASFYDSRTAYSTDGITWTAGGGVLANRGKIQSVAYGNGKFVAFFQDYAGYPVTSTTNGVTWVSENAYLEYYKPWEDIAFGDGRFVVASRDGYSSSIVTSTDIINWTYSSPSVGGMSSVAYGNSIWVIASKRSAFTTSAATATDGITWTARTLPVSLHWGAVRFLNDKFIILPYYNSSSTTAASSTDGITWTERTLPQSVGWRDAAYGNGTYVAIAYYASTSATSTDGLTWTERTMPNANGWVSIQYGTGKFFAIAYSITTAAYSTNGISWTITTMPTAPEWSDVAFASTGADSSKTLYTATIDANKSQQLKLGVTLGAENSIVVDGNTSLSYSAYGMELS